MNLENFDWAGLGSGVYSRVIHSTNLIKLKSTLFLAFLASALAAVGLLGASPALAQFSPSFTAGVASQRAGAFSSETVTIARGEGDEEFGTIAFANPPGLLGALSGVAICPGTRAEAGNCPASSRIGGVSVVLGPSFSTLYDEGGVYLTGPYKGAPYGVAIDVPVLVGLFDFGQVVSRASLNIDPSTAALSIASDPLPQSFDGFPLEIRTIRIDLDRKGFVFNPTSCGRGSFTATVASTSGTVASGASPFRAKKCGALPFKPKLSLDLAGQTNRGGHPKLTTVLKMPSGGANLKGIALTLPSTELVDSSHIKSAPIGFARVTSPILEKPIKGAVSLHSSGHAIPDLEIALRGDVDLDLAGRISSAHGGIRVQFASLPDVPLTKFTLTLDSGRRGLLVNSADLCQGQAHATAKLAGQNGAGARRNVPLRASCPPKR